MTNLAQLVPLPPISSVNRGLSRLRESVMLELLGVPGDPPQAGEKCGRLTNSKLQGLLQSCRIANLQFRSRAPGAVLDLLEQVFADVLRADPELFAKCRTNGSLCCRRIKNDGRSGPFSNHAWGMAIDLGFQPEGPGGFIAADPRGDGRTELGLLKLVPFFNAHGFFWGGAFSGDSEDSMHFEVSEQLARSLFSDGARGFRPAPPRPERLPESGTTQASVIAGPGGYLPPEGARRILGTILLGEAEEIEPEDVGIFRDQCEIILRLPSDVLFFEAGMQTDADGSPRAPEIDRFGQLETAFNFPNESGQARFVNAESVNYIVLPDNRLNDSERFFRKMGFQLGDIAAVIHKGILEFALFADIGPMGKLGEGSVRLVKALGVDPFIDGQVRVGIDEEVVYLVFPGSRPASLSPESVNEKVAEAGLRLFKELGGIVSSSSPTA